MPQELRRRWGELPLRLHVRNEPIPRRLLSCEALAYAEAYIVGGMLHSSVAAARILGRPCLQLQCCHWRRWARRRTERAARV